MIPTVLALDASLRNTGWATAPDTYGTIPTTRLPTAAGTRRDLRGAERLAHITTTLTRITHRHRPDLVAIEGYAHGAHSSSVTGLAELGGAIRLILHHLGVPYIQIAPATIKLYATGKGNATKAAMAAAAVLELNYPPPGEKHSDDIVDALWLHALTSHALGMPRTRVEGRRLDAIETATTLLDTIRPQRQEQ